MGRIHRYECTHHRNHRWKPTNGSNNTQPAAKPAMRAPEGDSAAEKAVVITMTCFVVDRVIMLGYYKPNIIFLLTIQIYIVIVHHI